MPTPWTVLGALGGGGGVPPPPTAPLVQIVPGQLWAGHVRAGERSVRSFEPEQLHVARVTFAAQAELLRAVDFDLAACRSGRGLPAPTPAPVPDRLPETGPVRSFQREELRVRGDLAVVLKRALHEETAKLADCVEGR